MTTILETIVPKSDQLNADDFIGGRTLTIQITKVSIAMGEQPVSIHYEGDNDKPYKPAKSMRRVLVNCWGPDANKYIGRSITLYRDEKVKFGGVDVGGIRISHLSNIAKPLTIALTSSKSQRKPFTVEPLIMGDACNRKNEGGSTIVASCSLPSADDFISDMQAPELTLDGLAHKWKEAQKLFKDSPEFEKIHAAKEKRKAALSAAKLEI